MAEQERLRAVRCVRQHVVHNKVDEMEGSGESEWYIKQPYHFIIIYTMPIQPHQLPNQQTSCTKPVVLPW